MQCKAKNRAGTRCKAHARRGQEVCRLHGGNAPQNIRAAKRREIQWKAGQMARAMAEAMGDEEKPLDPVAGILEACRRAYALMVVYGNLVGELDLSLTYTPKELPDGEVIAMPTGVLAQDAKNDIIINIILREYREAVTTTARLMTWAVQAGVAVAQVKVEQEKAAALAEMVRGVLKDLNLTPEQTALAPSIIRRHLLGGDDPPTVTIDAVAPDDVERG